jgi:leucyl aminopeptidase
MPHPLLAPETDTDARPIWLVATETLDAVLEELPPAARAFAAAAGFEPKPGRHCLLPDAEGDLLGVLYGLDGAGAKRADPFGVGKLPTLLPEGVYRFAAPPPTPALATLAWLLGAYRFERYREPSEKRVRLVPPEGVGLDEVSRIAGAVALGRNLVNTPANDLGPDGLETAARSLAERHGAEIGSIVGDELLAQNFPLIHSVGRAASIPPRLIDLRWGDPDAPRITVVGKGVAFDTGGLDIKPSGGMLLMKKDMGGAALMLALARCVMALGLPIRLRLLVPAVENSIGGAAFRPGDVLKMRSGTTVEITNTDAEGRLILADALAAADAEEPSLLLDAATLTGAARVAVGPELPALFTPDGALADELLRRGLESFDPLWRLPLHAPYLSYMKSQVADLANASSKAFAGSITAALFLGEFVKRTSSWAHLDVFAWNDEGRPGRPRGGEATGLRALLALVEARFAQARG